MNQKKLSQHILLALESKNLKNYNKNEIVLLICYRPSKYLDSQPYAASSHTYCTPLNSPIEKEFIYYSRKKVPLVLICFDILNYKKRGAEETNVN